VKFHIDGSLHPDQPPPAALASLAERVDFLSRLCSAWDFGILPDGETLREIRRRTSRKEVNECRLLTSPTYHLVRKWHRLPPVAFLGNIPPSKGATADSSGMDPA
jgi:hypothetical protein